MAVAGAAAAGIAIVMLATQFERPISQLTLREASSLAGIPPELMVGTLDGFVGVRAPSADDPQVALVFVPGDGSQPRTLAARARIDPEKSSDAFLVETLSCVPSTGLIQPNFIFGFVHLHDAQMTRFEVQPEVGHGTEADGAFVYVLNAGAPGALSIELRFFGGSAPTDWEAVTVREAHSFDRGNPCSNGPLPN